ncbi:MAG: hypothetical protein KC421_03760 [Anaerolineales bacterium]|nr:hypothetical protein [Anaerolineales bacterium]
MNLNELIDLTYAYFKGKRTKHPLEKSFVIQVLEDADIDKLLNETSTNQKASRLIIRRVYFRGYKWQDDQKTSQNDQEIIQENQEIPFEYDRQLHTGINGWVADNSRGKSTILKIIVWALTGVEPNLKSDTLAWLQEVAIEIEIEDDGIYTIQFYVRPSKPTVDGRIVELPIDQIPKDSPDIDSIKEFTGAKSMTFAIASFFGQRFGFQETEWVESKRYDISLKQKNISWEIYSQAMFLGSDNYNDFLFPDNTNRSHHQKAVSAYLGLDLIACVSRLEKLYREASQEHQLEDRRIKTNATHVEAKIKQLQRDLQIIDQKIKDIDNNQAAIIDAEYVTLVQEQVAQLTDMHYNTHSGLNKFLIEERSFREEKNLARKQAQEMRESIQFKLYISGLDVERCPLCETNIPIEQGYLNLDDPECRVCHNPLQKSQDTTQQERFLKKAEENIKRLDRELKRVKRSINTTREKLTSVERQLSERKEEYQDLSRQQRAGFTTELRELLNKRGYISGQLEELDQLVPHNQEDYLRRLKQKSEVLNRAKIILQNHMAEYSKQALGHLQRKATELALAFRVKNVQEVFLNYKFDLFARQSGKPNIYSNMEMGEQLRMKIAFHLAFLELRVKNNIGRHPGVLIIDAPGGAEMTDEIFNAILSGISEIDAKYGDKVQILTASTRHELADAFPPENIEHMPNDEPLF